MCISHTAGCWAWQFHPALLFPITGITNAMNHVISSKYQSDASLLVGFSHHVSGRHWQRPSVAYTFCVLLVNNLVWWCYATLGFVSLYTVSARKDQTLILWSSGTCTPPPPLPPCFRSRSVAASCLSRIALTCLPQNPLARTAALRNLQGCQGFWSCDYILVTTLQAPCAGRNYSRIATFAVHELQNLACFQT